MVLVSCEAVVDPSAATLLAASNITRGRGIPLEVLAIGGLLFFGGGWALIPKWWRSGLPGDEIFGRHIDRTFLANVIFLNSLTLVAVVAVAEDHRWVSPDQASIVGLSIASIGAVALITMGTIYFFNWPKFLVPPRMRSQPGRLARDASGNSPESEPFNRSARRRRTK